ncbi:Lrp/AsnC ligand binding domain-containing protein [Aquibaculum sediminis]|uniref:Lrp/AsnC ligand binding domain-containing protein n=1 Tax=Aquibaculum sediminis TaxID=3231907 RepID=UPI003456BCF7
MTLGDGVLAEHDTGQETRLLDRIDRRILRALQEEGRLTNVELARRVGLSPTPCLERVRRLERAGYITGYRAVLAPAKLDAALLAFVQVTLDRTTPDAFEQFRAAAAARPEVLECHMVAGGFDYLLKVRVRDMAAYRHFLGETLTAIGGIAQTHTYVVMEEVKSDGPLPIARG